MPAYLTFLNGLPQKRQVVVCSSKWMVKMVHNTLALFMIMLKLLSLGNVNGMIGKLLFKSF